MKPLVIKPFKVKVARAKPIDWEGVEQKTLLLELALRHPMASKLIFHVPNGGHRHKLVAIELKKQGVKAGIPDLVLPMARGGYFGLLIEFKATPPHDSPVSPQQDACLHTFNEQGYLAVVCRGHREALDVIGAYLKQPRTVVAA